MKIEGKNLTPFLIAENATILDAYKALNALSGVATNLFAVDTGGHVTGSITDGDLRRSIIAGHDLSTKLDKVMHRNFLHLEGDSPSVTDVAALRHNNVTLIPHLNADGTLRCLYDFTKLHSILPVDAVLMAGGKGERLRPMTLTTPKPLLKIGGRCIIDYNIDLLQRNGITNIAVTTNYLAEQIEEHFSGDNNGATINCVREPERRGTIGSLRLVDTLVHDTILVMNSDLLTDIDLEEFYISHRNSGAMMTIATIPYMVSVPFAILRYDGNRVIGLEEKPTFNHRANAGIYLIDRKAIDFIPKNSYFDATDLIQTLIDNNEFVGSFDIRGTWIDIGNPDDFRAAEQRLSTFK